MDKKLFNNLSGKLLIASPYALYGNIFYKSLIYVLLHAKEGSIGLILNHLVRSLPASLLFKTLAEDINMQSLSLPIHLGGPTELERVFFLHSDDYNKNLLFKFQDNLAISSNIDILRDIATGDGPKDSLFMLGYTSWKPGELEFELVNNLWLVSDCDKQLIFSNNNIDKWDIALKNLGINNHSFLPTAGHC